MISNKVKIGILTSSRADYGIYKPLLNLLKKDKRFDLIIIAFGMHLEKKYGLTIKDIESDNYKYIIKVNGMPQQDKPLDISKGYGKIVSSFSNFWNRNKFDLVFSLGDRFEMNAAVQAGIPFEINFAHLHGGDVTLGSIDNIYRDQISLASKLHFTSTKESSDRLKTLMPKNKNIYNVGALSIDNLNFSKILKWDKVSKKFDIPKGDFTLVTFHPETVGLEKNFRHVKILKESLAELSKIIHIVITQTNADGLGSLYMDMANKLKYDFPSKFTLVKSFGKENYFSAIKNSSFLLGNTSSGIIEAASFGKYVINVGKRQSGRVRSDNIIDVNFEKDKIIENCKRLISCKPYLGQNKHWKKDTSKIIIKKLETTLNLNKEHGS